MITQFFREFAKEILLGICLALLVSAGLILSTGNLLGLDQMSNTSTSETLQSLDKHNAYFATRPHFGDLIEYFENIAREYGGVYAFEVLKHGNLPPNSDSHLLGHYVGDILYEQEGIQAMQHCDESVGYACAHAIVINALLYDGPGVFDVINEVCASINKPGAYEMCFHGFGHGVLAYAEYDMELAVELCDRVGTPEYNGYEAVECIGGAVMEMRDGLHDKIIWERKRDYFTSAEDPLYICRQSYMSEEYKGICYIYITPYIFDHVLASDLPTADTYEEAMLWCETIEDEQHRKACYGGFGKEFIFFAHGRDGRLFENSSTSTLSLVHEWCDYAPNEEGRIGCTKHALYSTYRAGNVHYSAAIRLCLATPDENIQEACFSALIGSASQFHRYNEQYRDEFCGAVPQKYQSFCTAQFLTMESLHLSDWKEEYVDTR